MKKVIWLILAACLILGLGLGFTTKVHGGTAAREAVAIRPVDEAWRAALPRNPGLATQAYMDRISPAAKARSDAYFEGGYWLQLWSTVVTLGMFWLLLGTGASGAMRDFAERVTRRKPLQSMLYVAQFSVATTVLVFPLNVFAEFCRQHYYGMANQSFGPWLKEQGTGLVVSTVLMALVLPLLYGVVRRCSRTWWIWGSAVAVVFMVFAILIGPVFIDPIFKTYKPMSDGPVRQAILSLARSEGVPAKDVFVFDASKQTSNVSANVSGLFGTTAVRLNDNLLNRCTLPEIKGVMGHEMGHYVMNHVFKFLSMFTIILVAGFAFVAWSFEWLRLRWGGRWGVRNVGDVAGLPLFMALFTVFMFVLTPALNTMTRVQEAEADLFGVNASQEPDGCAEGELKLIEYRKSDPGPVEEFLFYDHPSPRKRIFTAMRWKAEHLPEVRK